MLTFPTPKETGNLRKIQQVSYTVCESKFIVCCQVTSITNNDILSVMKKRQRLVLNYKEDSVAHINVKKKKEKEKYLDNIIIVVIRHVIDLKSS